MFEFLNIYFYFYVYGQFASIYVCLCTVYMQCLKRIPGTGSTDGY